MGAIRYCRTIATAASAAGEGPSGQSVRPSAAGLICADTPAQAGHRQAFIQNPVSIGHGVFLFYGVQKVHSARPPGRSLYSRVHAPASGQRLHSPIRSTCGACPRLSRQVAPLRAGTERADGCYSRFPDSRNDCVYCTRRPCRANQPVRSGYIPVVGLEELWINPV